MTDDASDRAAPATVLRWALLLSPCLVPWLVVRTGGTTLVFPWGTVVAETGHVAPITAFLGGPAPRHLDLWPLAVACYAAALAWTGAGRYGADRRVAAGSFVLVAVVVARMAAGLAVDPNRAAIPIGTVHALALAGWLTLTDGPEASVRLQDVYR